MARAIHFTGPVTGMFMIDHNQPRPPLPMKCPSLVRWIPLSLAVVCASCGDNPALVEKREKQKVEIARLRGELALLEEQLKNLPPDVSKELEEAKKEAETQAADVASLEAEVASLESRKRALQGEYDDYRKKFPIK